MDWMKLAKQLADAASLLVPAVGVVPEAIELGEKLVDLIDDLQSKEPETRGSSELAFARKELADKVRAHADSTATRLEGGD